MNGRHPDGLFARVVLITALLSIAPVSGVLADPLPIAPGSWTLAILPDTQNYASSYPQHFNAQTQWIADHAVSHNIRMVLHEGDIVNSNNVSQWNNAIAAMSIPVGRTRWRPTDAGTVARERRSSTRAAGSALPRTRAPW